MSHLVLLCKLEFYSPHVSQRTRAMSQSAKSKGDTAATRDPDKTFDLARRCLYGNGMAKDEARAVMLLEPLAAQGHAGAQCTLGTCFANGQGVTRDVSRSLALFQLAADQEQAEAQHNAVVRICSHQVHDDRERRSTLRCQDARLRGPKSQ